MHIKWHYGISIKGFNPFTNLSQYKRYIDAASSDNLDITEEEIHELCLPKYKPIGRLK